MPRIKPPRAQAAPEVEELPIVEDHTPPTDAVEIVLAEEAHDAPAEIEVAPAAPAPEPAPAPAPPGDDALARAAEATRRAEELQRQNAELQRQNQQHATEIQRANSEREDAEYNSVLTAITAEQSTYDKAEADYAAFAQQGDWANAAKAQGQMARATARLDRLEEGKQSFETRREAGKSHPPASAPAPAPLDFESKVSALGVPDSAKSWLRKHPEFVNDAGKNNQIGATHNYLTATKGIEPFSTAYFEALDKEFGFAAAPALTPEPAPAAPEQSRRSIPMAAPVSRDVPTPSGQRAQSSKITLTPEERQIARTSFTAPDLTNAQKEELYARNKVRLAQQRANGSYPQPERN